MWPIMVVLLVLWAVLAVLGFMVEGLFWLAVVGIFLFAGTLVIGALIGNTPKS